MKSLAISSAIGLVCVLTATSASATIESWHLDATVLSSNASATSSGSFTVPGVSIGIDFSIDDQAYFDTWQSKYLGAITSIAFNGETSITPGGSIDVLPLTKNTLNAPIFLSRLDGLQQISFTTPNGIGTPYFSNISSIQDVLSSMTKNVSAPGSSLSLRFGDYVVLAQPLSLSAVPEMSNASLFALGIPFVLLAARRSKPRVQSQHGLA